MWSDEAVTVHIYSEWIELVELRRKHWCNGRRLFIAFVLMFVYVRLYVPTPSVWKQF